MARFPVSGHLIGTANFVGLNFGNAASTDIGDAVRMEFKGRCQV